MVHFKVQNKRLATSVITISTSQKIYTKVVNIEYFVMFLNYYYLCYHNFDYLNSQVFLFYLKLTINQQCRIIRCGGTAFPCGGEGRNARSFRTGVPSETMGRCPNAIINELNSSNEDVHTNTFTRGRIQNSHICIENIARIPNNLLSTLQF